MLGMETDLSTTKEKLKSDLLTALESDKRDQDCINNVIKAFEFAFSAHEKQRRRSGEPYIIHPVAVAITLVQLHCDCDTICAGLLHDVIEDTQASKDSLIKNFGETTYQLVDGVTKLGKLNFKSSEEEQANNFRKMLLAIAQDMRVVLVKLADRLNNMQTLMHLEDHKRQRIAKETLDIFAPLANRFGLHAIKSELEDLCLKYLHEEEFKQIKEIVASKREEREQDLKIVKSKIIDAMATNSIEAEVYARAKHFYSIYRKLSRLEAFQNGKLDQIQIFDLLGVRILVDSVKECYAVLGLIHDMFRPMPGRFKDYIAMPKSNMYQSLHTTVIVPWSKKPIEIQIRTHRMHAIAENGIAAHWLYKEAGKSETVSEEDMTQLSWLRSLVSWHTDLTDAKEYYENVTEDLFAQEVYALTPRGDVIAMPAGSTPVDFAYKIHSKIGDACSGAIVNEKIVPLSYKLQNGDLVEIIQNKNSHPNLEWLNFVQTNQAKHKIKAWFKRQNRDRHIEIAHDILEKTFGKEGLEQFIKSTELLEVAQKLNYKSTEDLLAALGSGDNSIAQVKGRLKGTKYAKEEKSPAVDLKKIKTRKAPSQGEGADIPELDGLLYHIAKCCNPIPGEHVTGVISKGKGITIHRSDCFNLLQVETDRCMELNWRDKAAKTYPASLGIEVVDRMGIVKDLLVLIADEGINVLDFKVKERPTENSAVLKATIEVTGVEQLKSILNKIKSMSDVLRVERV